MQLVSTFDVGEIKTRREQWVAAVVWGLVHPSWKLSWLVVVEEGVLVAFLVPLLSLDQPGFKLLVCVLFLFWYKCWLWFVSFVSYIYGWFVV